MTILAQAPKLWYNGRMATRQSDCHPDRKHYAHGLCQPCYQRSPDQRSRRRAAGRAYKQSTRGQTVYLERVYGITFDDKTRMLKEQNYQCKLCDTHIGGVGTNIAYVDHDHITSRVRGMLCNTCNTSLGRMEQPGWMGKAQAYLSEYKREWTG